MAAPGFNIRPATGRLRPIGPRLPAARLRHAPAIGMSTGQLASPRSAALPARLWRVARISRRPSCRISGSRTGTTGGSASSGATAGSGFSRRARPDPRAGRSRRSGSCCRRSPDPSRRGGRERPSGRGASAPAGSPPRGAGAARPADPSARGRARPRAARDPRARGGIGRGRDGGCRGTEAGAEGRGPEGSALTPPLSLAPGGDQVGRRKTRRCVRVWVRGCRRPFPAVPEAGTPGSACAGINRYAIPGGRRVNVVRLSGRDHSKQ